MDYEDQDGTGISRTCWTCITTSKFNVRLSCLHVIGWQENLVTLSSCILAGITNPDVCFSSFPVKLIPEILNLHGCVKLINSWGTSVVMK